jgi:multidrug efflux pump subunit AcrB
MQIPTGTGEAVPLAAVANFRYELEQPTVWRRSRIPTITIKAGMVGDALPATAVAELKPAVDDYIARSCPTATTSSPPARSRKAPTARARSSPSCP